MLYSIMSIVAMQSVIIKGVILAISISIQTQFFFIINHTLSPDIMSVMSSLWSLLDTCWVVAPEPLIKSFISF